jgi:hypothetical protein
MALVPFVAFIIHDFLNKLKEHRDNPSTVFTTERFYYLNLQYEIEYYPNGTRRRRAPSSNLELYLVPVGHTFVPTVYFQIQNQKYHYKVKFTSEKNSRCLITVAKLTTRDSGWIYHDKSIHIELINLNRNTVILYKKIYAYHEHQVWHIWNLFKLNQYNSFLQWIPEEVLKDLVEMYFL